MKPAAAPAPPPQPAAPAGAQGRALDTQALFEGANTLAITHQGERYQLRITRQGKLILTK